MVICTTQFLTSVSLSAAHWGEAEIVGPKWWMGTLQYNAQKSSYHRTGRKRLCQEILYLFLARYRCIKINVLMVGEIIMFI